ncbi:MAG: DUF559 domain-containing protein [Aeromicrobium sp.]
MARPPLVPDVLRDRVFTTSEAAEAGLTSSMLRGSHVVQVHRGVWRLASTELTFDLHVRAGALALPSHAALSHVSALRWMGIPVGRDLPIHFSVNGPTQTRSDIVLHRRQGRISTRDVRGVATLGSDRSFVDSATLLGLRDLVCAGDALVRRELTSTEALIDYTVASHLDGVVRAREAAMLVRDLVLSQWRVIVEHDGWHHERDAAQRQKDHLRRERIEAAGRTWRRIARNL